MRFQTYSSYMQKASARGLLAGGATPAAGAAGGPAPVKTDAAAAAAATAGTRRASVAQPQPSSARSRVSAALHEQEAEDFGPIDPFAGESLPR
jgi:hypothetical protein